MQFKFIFKIYEDLCFYSEESFISKLKAFFFKANFHLIFWYRLSHYFVDTKFSFINVFIKYICQILYSSEISPSAVLGKNLLLPHPLGIIIGDKVVIHDNVTIFQQVTIGAKGGNSLEKSYPVIGKNVTIYTKASLIGDIKIGENSIIGAHVLVLKNIKENSIFIGKN